MRFQIVHVGRRHSRACQRVLYHPLLCRTVRHRGSRARAVLVDRRAADHAPDAVAVRLRLAQPLQDDHPAALAAHEAVRRGIERVAAAGMRQHSQLGHLPCQAGRQDGVHATHQSQVHFTLAQGGDRLVHRHQRRRAVERHRHGRPLQTQLEGDASDRHAPGGAQVVDARATARHQIPVLAGGNAGKDTGAGAPQPVGIDPRVVERLPTRLQQHPLLRIHRPRPDRWNPEEPRVEAVDPVDKAAPPGKGILERGVSGDATPGTGIAPAIGHGVRAGFELTPEGRQIGSAGEAARHADDRDAVIHALPG